MKRDMRFHKMDMLKPDGVRVIFTPTLWVAFIANIVWCQAVATIGAPVVPGGIGMVEVLGKAGLMDTFPATWHRNGGLLSAFIADEALTTQKFLDTTIIPLFVFAAFWGWPFWG